MAATECHHAVHHTQITRASIPCHNSRLAIAVSSGVTDAAHRSTTNIAASGVGGWVVVRCGWLANFNTFMTFCNRRAVVTAKSAVLPKFGILALLQRYQCARNCTVHTASV